MWRGDAGNGRRPEGSILSALWEDSNPSCYGRSNGIDAHLDCSEALEEERSQPAPTSRFCE